MNDLKTLIRAQKWKLDEQRRALAVLQALEGRLADEKRRLEEEMRAEQAAARSSPETAVDYGTYALRVIERRKRIEESMAQVAQQIASATEQITESFQELKRYELAQEGRSRRQRERLRKRESAMLDEVGVSVYARRRRETVR